jgi:hypothetical protein
MEPISYAIQADERFYQQTFDRYRSSKVWRRMLAPVRYFVAAYLMYVAIREFSIEEFGFSLVLTVVAAVILGARWIDWFILRHRLRRSPFLGDNAVVHLDDHGIHGDAQLAKGSMTWPSCTKAIEFRDGVLLYHGPTYFRWLPHAALSDGTTPADAVDFIRRHVENFHKR